ncbi:MAG: hypothetical protein QOE65_3031 [Solirubrobacteraceae bacterium]|jgi:uncharacterized membrane protein (DUF485 family)|nr:hypothetical protein [Solirubrobacteraceae bacterium]
MASRPAIDWGAAVRTPEFQELVRAKRRWVVGACAFFFTWYFGFVLLAGYAESFMGRSIYQGFTVGYALALSQFAMTWFLCAWYLRKASREWDPLRDRARRRALELSRPGTDSSPMGISRPSGNGAVEHEEVAR